MGLLRVEGMQCARRARLSSRDAMDAYQVLCTERQGTIVVFRTSDLSRMSIQRARGGVMPRARYFRYSCPCESPST